ncbi:MAG TPA: hypothetical protein VF228_23225 [Iamia sp.]
MTGAETDQHRRARIVLIGGTALLALLRGWAALRADGMTSLPDEIGFLGDAWLVGRGQPAPPMAFSPLYPGTYPLILAPVAAVVDDIDAQLTIARLVNVALLAALVPAVWALLGRWGRLAPMPRAVVALAASALPGLSVAALRAWPDVFLALGWVLALLALSALARPGPLPRRVWFGPLVGILAAAHARFTPVLVLAALVLVLRLVAPPRDERTTGRQADVLNLAGLVVATVLGRVVDGIVEARWSRVAPSAAERLRDEPGRVFGDLAPSLVGQTWFAVVATCGTAAIGAVVAVRLAAPAARRGRALWCEPVPLLASVALLGAVGVQLATAVQIRGGEVLGTTAFDLLANGRYQDVVLVPLVALGLGSLVRRSPGPIGLEVGVALAALATAVMVYSRLDDPAFVVDPAFVAAWNDDDVIRYGVFVPTVAVLVVLAATVLLRRTLRVGLVPLLVLTVFVGVGFDRSERLVDASSETDAMAPDVSDVREVLDGERVAFAYENRTLWATILIGWALAEEGVEAYPSGETPPERFVIAPVGDDGQPDVAGLEGAERRADIPPSGAVGYPLALWELPES